RRFAGFAVLRRRAVAAVQQPGAIRQRGLEDDPRIRRVALRRAAGKELFLQGSAPGGGAENAGILTMLVLHHASVSLSMLAPIWSGAYLADCSTTSMTTFHNFCCGVMVQDESGSLSEQTTPGPGSQFTWIVAMRLPLT